MACCEKKLSSDHQAVLDVKIFFFSLSSSFHNFIFIIIVESEIYPKKLKLFSILTLLVMAVDSVKWDNHNRNGKNCLSI